jgi:hypothetical protein
MGLTPVERGILEALETIPGEDGMSTKDRNAAICKWHAAHKRTPPSPSSILRARKKRQPVHAQPRTTPGAAFAAHDKAIMDEANSRRDESLANIRVFGLGKKPPPRNS